MISARKTAVFVLLLFLLSGCKHKVNTLPPVIAQAPLLPPKPNVEVAELPPVPPPPAPNVGPPGSDEPKTPPAQKPKRTTHKKPKTTAPASDQTKEPVKETPAQQEASAGEPPEMSPIGQLSTTGDNTGTPARNEIVKQIDDTEKGLSAIKRALNSDEQTTAAEIRTFLSKAKQALSQDDLAGANTLVTKAKVLLDELTKS
jgi:hypothetical protein